MSAENTRDYYRNQGAESERERIIKLLDSLKDWDSTIPIRESHADAIIALIKGETE